MRGSEISPQEIAVWRALRATGAWMTTLEIAVRAEVAPRTARAHAWKLARLRVADFVEVFPGRRYRIAEPNANNQDYIDRLTKAEEALGSQGHRGISATRGAIPRR